MAGGCLPPRRRAQGQDGLLPTARGLAFEPAFTDLQLLRRRRLALDDAIVRELDELDGHVQVPVLATAPDPEPDVLTQPLVEETEDGASALTLQRLASDAHDEIPRLQRGRRRIEAGRETCNPAQGIQVHT